VTHSAVTAEPVSSACLARGDPGAQRLVALLAAVGERAPGSSSSARRVAFASAVAGSEARSGTPALRS
jgi:hypothetical protein